MARRDGDRRRCDAGGTPVGLAVVDVYRAYRADAHEIRNARSAIVAGIEGPGVTGRLPRRGGHGVAVNCLRQIAAVVVAPDQAPARRRGQRGVAPPRTATWAIMTSPGVTPVGILTVM